MSPDIENHISNFLYLVIKIMIFMNKSRLLFLLIFTSISFLMCNREEVTPREYPVLRTLAVKDITSTGAVFEADVKHLGSQKIIEHGFLWSFSSGLVLPNVDKAIINEEINKGKFSKEVESTLIEGKEYFVKAFIKTGEFLVYGNVVSFISLGSKGPKILDVKPLSGTIGDTVMIRGANFSFKEDQNIVQFEDKISRIIYTSDTLLKIIVPGLSIVNNKVSVSTVGNKTVYNDNFKLSSPVITQVLPFSAAIDDTITIKGSNFSFDLIGNVVEFGGVKSKVVESNKNNLRVIIPVILGIENPVSVTISGQKTVAAEKFIFKEPIITGISSNSGHYGDVLIFEGQNLSPVSANNVVKFQNHKAKVIAESRSKLLVTVPDEITQTNNKISVEVAGRIFNFQDFKIRPPVIENVLPSIVVAPEGIIELQGKGFNAIKSRNYIFIEESYAKIVEASHSTLKVTLPRSIIPDLDFSVNELLDLRINIGEYDQVYEKAIKVGYKSIFTKVAQPSDFRAYPLSFSLNNKGYYGLGGRIDPFKGNHLFFKDLWEYDPVKDKWERMPDYPGPGLERSSVFTIGSKAYIVGGAYDFINGRLSYSKEVWQFDGLTKVWTKKRDFPGNGRQWAHSFSIKSNGFFGGGHNRGYANDFWKYDPKEDNWEQINDLPNDVLWTSGAVSNNVNAFIVKPDEIWMYEDVADEWNLVEAMDNGLEQVPFICKDVLYYYGDSHSTSAIKLFSKNLINGFSTYRDFYFTSANNSEYAEFTIGIYSYLILYDQDNDPQFLKFDPSKL
jgi:hypothetical protein